MEAEVEIKIEPDSEELLDLPKPEIVRESHEKIKIKTENIDKIEIDTDTHLPLSLEPLKIEESEPSPLKSEPVESTVDDESQNVPPPPTTPPDLCQGQGSPVQSVEGSSTTNTLGVENLVTKKKVKPLIGRIETVRKTYRKFFCKLCMAQVPSLEKLVIHLDREHKIRVKGPARVVVGEDRDDKKDLKVTSDLLKSIDNMPRTTEPLSESESSDEESDTDSEFDPAEEEEGLTSDSDDDEETSYLKLRTRTQKWMFHQQRVWSARIKSQLDDPNFLQCHFCFVELSKRPRFRFVKSFHLRQHSDGEYKVCPHCSMPFLYEHQLDKHLEELAVPVVPPGLSRTEEEDLLYTSHSCQGGLAGSSGFGCGCGAQFANRKCLLFHMTQAHDHYHRCPTCEKPYVLYSRLVTHIQRSHNWEGRMMNCPVPDCNKLFNTKKGISSHFIHIHSKEEKDQYYPNNQFNDRNEQTSVVRHNTPQTFWRMITAHWDKTRAYKIKAERAKRTSIWEKPQKFTPSSSVTVQVKLENPAPKPEINQSPKPVFTKWPSTTPTSFPNISASGNIRWGNLAGVSSIPSKEYTGGQLSKKPLHKLFLILCGFCARSFRNATTRNRHVIATHKIDTSLERPYKCPAEGCDYDRTELKSLLKHIRRFHPVSVEEALVRKSLEEDKATAPEGEEEFFQSILRVKTEVEEEAKKKEPSNPPAPQKTVNRVATATASSSYPRRRRPAPFSRDNKSRIRGRNTFEHMYQSGPTAQRVRAVLETFTLGSGYYCPECPIHSRKPMTTTRSVHRHLAGFHPYSKILKDPDSEKLQSTNQDVEETRLKPTPETNTNQGEEESDSDENMEVEPEGIEDEEDQGSEHDSEAVDDSDFITHASDPSMLAIFRRFLRKYELYPHIPNNYTVSCPICKEASVDATFARTHSLQDHILKVHPGCELLRKSNLVDLSPNQLTGSHRNKQKNLIVQSPLRGKTKRQKNLMTNVTLLDQIMEVAPETGENCEDEDKLEPSKGVGQKNLIVNRKMKLTGFRGVDRITKMKSKAIHFFRGARRKKRPGPLTRLMSKYKTKSGKTFYCPDCASLDTERTFSSVGNLIRHMRTFHQDSEVFKISQGQRFRGRKQSSESEESGDEVYAGLDNVDDGSDSEVEVAPETEELCEDDFELPPNQNMTEDSGFKSDVKSEPSSPQSSSCAVNLKPEVDAVKNKEIKEVRVNLEQITLSVNEVKKINQKRIPHSDGRWYCNLCPEKDQPSYTLVKNLNRHLATKHNNKFINWKPSNSTYNKKVEISPQPHYSKTDYVPLPATSPLPLDIVSDSNSGSDESSSNLTQSSTSICESIPAAETQEIAWAEISKICSKTNPNKIQCPLCPEIVTTRQGKQMTKPVYISYLYLYRHFERGCYGWKTLHPECPRISVSQGRWTCAWCSGTSFSLKLSLISHVKKEHSEVTLEENEAHADRIRITLFTCPGCQEVSPHQTDFGAHRCNQFNESPKASNKDESLDKDEPVFSRSSTLETPNEAKVDDEVSPAKSPPQPESISHPNGDSVQFSLPNSKNSSTSDEDIFGSRLQIIIDRSPIVSKPVPQPEPEVEEQLEEEDGLEIECATCSKKFLSEQSLRGHQSWHKRRGEKIEDGGQIKRSKLSEDYSEDEIIDVGEEYGQVGDGLEEELPPEFGEEEGLGNQLEPLSLEEQMALDRTFTNDELEAALQDVGETLGAVEDKCPFCYEWFSFPKEKEDHIIRDHSFTGLPE